MPNEANKPPPTPILWKNAQGLYYSLKNPHTKFSNCLPRGSKSAIIRWGDEDVQMGKKKQYAEIFASANNGGIDN